MGKLSEVIMGLQIALDTYGDIDVAFDDYDNNRLVYINNIFEARIGRQPVMVLGNNHGKLFTDIPDNKVIDLRIINDTRN